MWLSGGGELRSMGVGAGEDGVVGEVGLEKGDRLPPVGEEEEEEEG